MTDRKLASVQMVLAVDPIPGADNIVRLTVNGWELVAKKDEFQPGDLGVYIEIDSVLPEKPEFEFLRDTRFRVKTRKFRKQVSQGIMFPLSILPARWPAYCENEDVTKLVGVVKYDPQGDAEREMVESKQVMKLSRNPFVKFMLRFNWFRKLVLRPRDYRGWPKHVTKTDEERVQNIKDVCARYADRMFEVTEKLDGQSATYTLIKTPKGLVFSVCSRNVNLGSKPDGGRYWQMAVDNEIEKMLTDLIANSEYVTLQGEIIGEGIQGNKYGLKGHEFRAYNLIFPEVRLPYALMEIMLKGYPVKCVPLVSGSYRLPGTVQELVDFSQGLSLLAKTQREGVVLRSYSPEFVSFKVINPAFLLKHDE